MIFGLLDWDQLTARLYDGGTISSHTHATSYMIRNNFSVFRKIKIFNFQIFDDRLRCNTQCKRKKDAEERQICEEKYCKEIEEDDNDSVIITKGQKKDNLKKNKDEEEKEIEEESEETKEKEKKKIKDNNVDE